MTAHPINDIGDKYGLVLTEMIFTRRNNTFYIPAKKENNQVMYTMQPEPETSS
jgi:hypothetical protein